jgi:predicted aspartyl protease
VRLREGVEKELEKTFKSNFGEAFYPIVKVRFKRSDEIWTEKLFTLIFDTGASITLLPPEMAEYLGLTNFVGHEMTGVVRKEECRLSVNLSKVKIRLEDDLGTSSTEFEIWIAISKISETPLLFGMKDILDRFSITVLK